MNIVNYISTHKTQTYTALGIVTSIGGFVYGIVQAPKVKERLSKKKAELGGKLCVKDWLKIAVPPMILPITLETASVIMMSKSCSTGLKSTAFAISTSNAATKAYERIKKELEEGGKSDIVEKIEKEVTKEEIRKNPPAKARIFDCGGETLWYDRFTGRYFKADKIKIERAVNKMNETLRNENYISLNEFYELIGLPYVDVGTELGWSIDTGYVEVDYGTMFADEEETTPCGVIRFSVTPYFQYSRGC